MATLGPRPRDLRIPTELEVRRRVRRTSAGVFCVFLAIGLLVSYAPLTRAFPILAAITGIGLLVGYGVVLSYLLMRAARREIALLRTTTVFFEGLPVGALLLDEAGHITYANPAIERLAGYAANGLAGKGVASFVHTRDHSRLMREFERLKAGNPGVFELRVLSAGGQTLQTVVTALPFVDGGRYDGALAVVSDITEVLAARSDAQRYQQLSAFALDAVTHDLSNRMQAVVARTGLAAVTIRGEDARAKAAAEAALKAAEQAARLIKEVKQIATAEREEWPKRTMDVASLVDRSLTLADIPAGIAVEADVAPDVAAARLQASDLAPLVLSKLLEQASEGAQAERQTSQVRLEALVDPGRPTAAVLRVHGFNRAISDEDLRLMLAPPREAGGRDQPWRAGVKLALAAAVAQAHGWGVRAAREDGGKGAVFEVHIPIEGL